MGDRFMDRSVLVTGGVSGIGRAIAFRFASEGARVTVTGLSDEDVESFRSESPKIRAVRLDVTDSDSIDSLVGSEGELDVLVNTAGTIQRDGREFSLDGFTAVVDVNLNGTMRMCMAFRESLKRSRGSVINIGSLFSTFGAPHAPAYSASKGAVVQLTKSLAAAWAPDGIRVNAIAPGWIETAFTQPVSEDGVRSDRIVERTPLGRWGTPEDVAGPVLFLASDDARFVTGSVIPVDGGYSVV